MIGLLARMIVTSCVVGPLIAGIVGPLTAQEPANPTLSGTAFVGDAPLEAGTVVLHHLADGVQGELDSLGLGTDGRFSFALPRVPDPTRSDVFFASVRHQGVLYFGPAITTAVQLDSLYEIHAWDTLVAPAEGMPVAVQSRSVFFEPDSVGWRVTDLIQLRNDETRTIVAAPGGRVWSYALPAGARDVTTGQGELAADAVQFEDGELVVRAALPPGERIFVLRYAVDSLFMDIPNDGTAEAFDVLVREPAPSLDVEGLELLDRIELEAGSTYLRFSAADVSTDAVRIVPVEESGPPRVEWAAVVLALVLAAAGVMALRPRASAVEAVPASGPDRRTLMLQVAQLDEDFLGRTDPDPADREAYRRRREDLIRRIRDSS